MKYRDLLSIDPRAPLADPERAERLAERQRLALIRLGARALVPWDPRPGTRPDSRPHLDIGAPRRRES